MTDDVLLELEVYARELEQALREARRVGDGESEAILREGAATVCAAIRRFVARAQPLHVVGRTDRGA